MKKRSGIQVIGYLSSIGNFVALKFYNDLKSLTIGLIGYNNTFSE
jgi:hypothetical protein